MFCAKPWQILLIEINNGSTGLTTAKIQNYYFHSCRTEGLALTIHMHVTDCLSVLAELEILSQVHYTLLYLKLDWIQKFNNIWKIV